jgi:hypothetical protein
MSREKNMKKIILLITVLSLSTFVSAGFFSDDKDKVKNEDNVVEQKYSKTEFHGLKAGMTKTEVMEYLQFDKIFKYLKTEYPSLYRDKTIDDILTSNDIASYRLSGIKHKDFLPRKEFDHINVSFTDDDILWKIQIRFSLPDDVLAKIALKDVIKNNFPGATIKEEKGTRSGSYGTFPYHYLYVIMADQKIAESAIIKLKNKYKTEM